MKKLLGEAHKSQVVYIDPGCASQNIGDQIISDSACQQMESLLSGLFPFHVSSYQKMSFRYRRYLNKSAYIFVLGSNLLKGGMLTGFRQWDVSLFDTLQINNAVLVGCGWHAYSNHIDTYSKVLYSKLLSSSYCHSVRDEFTKTKMNELGFTNVINTGCPTLWNLTESACERIPRKKANSAVFTITDYNQDTYADSLMIEILLEEYKNVYVWFQGNGDRDYVQDICDIRKCTVIPSTLASYDSFLLGNEVDYIGTRLHGGIRALQHGRRALIISIDNRAKEMGSDFNLPVLERASINELSRWINGGVSTEIMLKNDQIKQFKEQFKTESSIYGALL